MQTKSRSLELDCGLLAQLDYKNDVPVEVSFQSHGENGRMLFFGTTKEASDLLDGLKELLYEEVL